MLAMESLEALTVLSNPEMIANNLQELDQGRLTEEEVMLALPKS